MTGNLSMLAPGMIAVAVAGRVVGDTSIYTSQLSSRLREGSLLSGWLLDSGLRASHFVVRFRL
jgi:hypothetical protein